MTARPRMTVRLSPSRLHQLAWLAQRAGWTPGELARDVLTAYCERTMVTGDLEREWRAAYNAWLADTAGLGDRAETPAQRDYDRMAERGLRPVDALPPPRDTAETLPAERVDEPTAGSAPGADQELTYTALPVTIMRKRLPSGRKYRA